MSGNDRRHTHWEHTLPGSWAGRSDEAALRDVAARIRRDTWDELNVAGLGSVPGNTFSYYDHVLDTALAVDAVPERFAGIADPLRRLFAMARGAEGAPACEMTKWFDTNYHYLVPELGPDTTLAPRSAKIVDEFREAQRQGVTTRPVLVGPVTLLLGDGGGHVAARMADRKGAPGPAGAGLARRVAARPGVAVRRRPPRQQHRPARHPRARVRRRFPPLAGAHRRRPPGAVADVPGGTTNTRDWVLLADRLYLLDQDGRGRLVVREDTTRDQR